MGGPASPRNLLDLETVRAMIRSNKDRCLRLVQLIRRRAKDGKDGFYDVGRALGEIRNDALFSAAGHGSFAAFLKAEGLPGPARANKLVAVAELLARDDAVNLGPEKAYALTQLARATGETRPIASLARQRDLVDGKSAEDASVREILQAARHERLRRGKRQPLDDRRDRATRTAREAQAAARRLGHQDVRVSACREGSGFRFTVDISEQALRKLFRMD